MSTPKFMCVDTETTGLDWTMDRLHGIGVGYAEGEATYYPVWNIPGNVRADLENPNIAKIGHNLHGFDAKFIRKCGINIQGNFNDTMILANLLDSDSRLGLKMLSDKYLGAGSLDNKNELDRYISAHKAGHIAGLCAKDLLDVQHPHLDIIARYCCEDVVNTMSLFFLFYKKLEAFTKELKAKGHPKGPIDYYKEEARPLERVLFDMEYRGIRINVSVIESIREKAVSNMERIAAGLSKTFQKSISVVEDQLVLLEQGKVTTDVAKAKRLKGVGKCKFNWGNNNHVGAVFANVPALKPLLTKTPKGKYVTDKAALEKLAAECGNEQLAKALKEFSAYKLQSKIALTYTGSNSKGIMSKIRYVTADGVYSKTPIEGGVPRIFPVYRQTTGTGRLACSNPNMQNLKRDSEIKRMFVPDSPDEVFDDADYSQIELRTGAHQSQDEALCSSYINGEDVHLRTASRLFGRPITKADDLERQAGKRTNFLTIFDGGSFRLQASLKADTGKEFSLEQCQGFIDTWFEEYYGVREYLDEQLEFFKKTGYCVSETGRVRLLPDIFIKKHFKFEGREPVFVGPDEVYTALVKEFIKKNPNTFIDEQGLYRLACKKYNHAVKAGYNMPIQGLAASLTKRAMIALAAQGVLPANQVHDSLTVARKRDDEASKTRLVNVMENIYKLTVPVLVDVKTLTSFHPNDKVKA